MLFKENCAGKVNHVSTQNMNPGFVKVTARLMGVSFALVLVAGCASSRTVVIEEKEFIPLYHLAKTSVEKDTEKTARAAMRCVKCKTIVSKDTRSALSRRFFKPRQTLHHCPGCKSVITITWSGLKSNREVKHSCHYSCDKRAFCCVTSSDARRTE